MSMIHGMIRFDGRQPDGESLRPMIEAGKAASPDGAETWNSGGAALGLGLLRTLPRARTAAGPVRDTESGLVIVADARIDNRPELWGKLGLREGGKLNDAELLLRAYRKWGEACVEHLVGDFAFAIWDEIQRKLYCARDIFGIKPFYYFHTPDSFIFSSNVPSLLALEEVPRELDEYCIADVLAGLSMDADQTLYRGIAFLPPAHCMTDGERGIALQRYWQPQTGNAVRFARDEEYVEAYRGLLEEAVACRLETDGNVSGLLSGGLDSGAIAVIAAKILAAQGREYATYSFVLAPGQNTRERDEREWIDLVHGVKGIKGHFIATQDFPGRAADLYKGAGEHAFLGNTPHLAALFLQLGNANASVLLDGYGGDQCPTIGSDIPLQEFLDGFQFMRLSKYLAASARFYGSSRLRLLLRMLRNHFQTNGVMSIDELVFERSVLSGEFGKRANIRDRARQNKLFQPVRHRSLGDIMAYRLSQGRGLQYHPLFSANRVERRYPFFDRRLVEFSLSVPSVQHNFDMNRRLIRRATEGMLPDEIRLRNDKNVNNAPGGLSFLNENREYHIAAIDAARHNGLVSACIDLDKLRKRFAEALPGAIDGRGKLADFMPGPTLRAFNMLQFLRQHTEKNEADAP